MELLPDDFLIVWKYPKYVINGKKKIESESYWKDCNCHIFNGTSGLIK